MLKDLFLKNILNIQDKIFDYRTNKLEPSVWVEQNMRLTSAESKYVGLFDYDRTPYLRDIINDLSDSSPVIMVAIMKASQTGGTAGIIVPMILYIISESPNNVMFLSGNETLVRDTMRDRLDPVIQNSGLTDLLRPNVQKKKNQKSGDTDTKKEFRGGSLTAMSYLPSKLRFYSAKYMLCDEFDDAPRYDKKEGSIRSLVEARTKSFGASKKILFNSSPTIKGASNIEDVYLDGDQRKWNWECPHCKEYIPIEWRVEREDGTFGGIKYKLDELNELIESSVHYECQKCKGKIQPTQKYDLNLKGKWIPTAKPKDNRFRSYQINALIIPPGFDSWVDIVKKWLDACPPGKEVDEGKLKTFINTMLGQTWEDRGKELSVNEMMVNNVRPYQIGVVPDKLIKEDGNGRVILLTLACDLGGLMEVGNEDVRLDWEIIAHSSTGCTYSVQHGSIGTFKNTRQKTSKDKDNTSESNRDIRTAAHGQRNSIWDDLRELMYASYQGQDGTFYNIDLTVIDTGFSTNNCYAFIKSIKDRYIVGVKGYGEEEYRNINKDTPIIKRSAEMQGQLYILQVNQMKDMLAANMALSRGIDGYQPTGFMNFPQSSNGLYAMKNYFSHFTAEKRFPVIKNDIEVGYSWKKQSGKQNHFFDVYNYNIAARYIYIDIIRKLKPKYSTLTWELFVQMIDTE